MMWAKRFPLIDFQYESLKDSYWPTPSFLSEEQIAEKITNGSIDEDMMGCFAIPAPDSFFDHFSITGEFRHAVMCVTPKKKISILGRSHAWKKQRLLIVDSLNPSDCNVLVDWKTARPMSTRLGPKEGAEIQGGVWYALFTSIIGDRFVGNRSILETKQKGSKEAGSAFSILTSSEPEISDFHDCNLYASW